MSNELVVVQAMSTIGQIIRSVSSAKPYRIIRKQEIVVLEEQLLIIKRACRIKGHGQLTRLCIDEMEKTLQKVEQTQASGMKLEMYNGLLQTQYQALQRTLQNYDNVS